MTAAPPIVGICGGTSAQRVAVMQAVCERFGFARAAVVGEQLASLSADAEGYIATVRDGSDEMALREIDGYIVAIESDEAGCPQDVEPDLTAYWSDDADGIAHQIGLTFALVAPEVAL